MRSAQISSGSPMDTQMSVYSTSQSLAPCFTSSVSSMVAPVSAAPALHFSTRSAAGISSLGPQAQKCIPSLAQTTIRELATLLRASPKKVSLRPRTSPNSSFTVRMSASIWVGWKASVRPFHTGTPE